MKNNESNPSNKKLITSFNKWQGYNYFPLKGKILMGPTSFKPTLMTSTSITLPVILFLSFNSKYMKENLSISIPIILSILYIITMVFLLIASFSDPGILQRYPCHKNIIEDRKEVKIIQSGFFRKYRHCGTCDIIRPSRSTHCGDCNNCVERFDHHCPWIGNCAGKRNYKFFYIFLVFLNIMTVFIGVFSIYHISKFTHDSIKYNQENKAASALSQCIISVFLIIYCGLSMLFTTGLLIYHSKLVSKNMTTKEELKKYFDNPFGDIYTRNFQRNCQNVLFPKLANKSILDILNWETGNNDDVSTSDDRNELTDNGQIKNDISKDINKCDDKISNVTSEKYSDVNEDLSSTQDNRVIPKFDFDLNMEKNKENPI